MRVTKKSTLKRVEKFECVAFIQQYFAHSLYSAYKRHVNFFLTNPSYVYSHLYSFIIMMISGHDFGQVIFRVSFIIYFFIYIAFVSFLEEDFTKVFYFSSKYKHQILDKQTVNSLFFPHNSNLTENIIISLYILLDFPDNSKIFNLFLNSPETPQEFYYWFHLMLMHLD